MNISLSKFHCTILLLLGCIFAISTNIQAQTCASTSSLQYEWPGHRNWFIAAGNGWTGQIINMQTFAVTTAGTPGVGASAGGGAITAYEGNSAVSDDNGNLLFYQNGRRIWTGTGGSVVRTYAGLLEGNEGGMTGNNGSASQGTITFRHPLNPNVYHIFTTDDANSGSAVGLNHFTVTPGGVLISGPTRLGTFRTSEALAATRHANGVDFWVTAVDITGKFNAYLLKCDGMDIANSNLDQPNGPNVSADKNYERGGLAFSWDGKKLAQAHGSGTATQKVSIYDFDNATGAITNRMDICKADQIFGPYDLIFSPDNKRLFVSMQNSTLNYYDLSSGVQATIQASQTSTGISCGVGAAIKIGPNGKLFMARGNVGGSAGLLRMVNEDLNTSNSFTTTDIAGTETALGLPSMFIPPLDSAKIQPHAELCTIDAAVDLSTLWACAGTDVEQLTHTYSATCGACIDPNTGMFDPSVAGVGNHTITFTLTNPACSPVTDTEVISVKNCACNDTTLVAGNPTVCAGTDFDLNSIKTTTEAGVWSIISSPAGGSPATIVGNTFTSTSGSNTGVYTVKYTLNNKGDASCPDGASRTITLKPSTTDLGSPVTVCSTDGPLVITASNTDPAAVWSSNPTGLVSAGKVSVAAAFAALGGVAGKVVITYGGGCIAPTSVDVNIEICCVAPTNLVINATDNTICDGDTSIFTANSNKGLGSNYIYKWYLGTVDSANLVERTINDSTFVATVEGNYIVVVSDQADTTTCSATSAAFSFTVNDLPSVSVNSETVCEGAPASTFIATAPTATSFLWSDKGTGSSSTTSGSDAGNYTVTVTDGNSCTNSATGTLTVNTNPVVNIDDKILCSGTTLVLDATTASATYLWSDGSTNPTLTVSAAGNYQVTVTVNGCSDSDDANVVGAISPTVTLPKDTTICVNKGESYLVILSHNGTPGGNITWSTGASGVDNVLISVVANVTGTYTDLNGCSGSDAISITNYCETPDVYTPTIVIPGTENPTFTPFGTITPADVLDGTSTYEVYDRWGLKMYQSNEDLPVWDCTHNGNLVSSGVYFWIWKYQDVTETKHEKNGYVQVVIKK